MPNSKVRKTIWLDTHHVLVRLYGTNCDFVPLIKYCNKIEFNSIMIMSNIQNVIY